MRALGRACTANPAEMLATANFVRSLSGLPTDPKADLALGKKTFADNCSPCHGEDGKGNKDMGAPNLTTEIWLYGSETEAIVNRITNGGGGRIPDSPGAPVLLFVIHRDLAAGGVHLHRPVDPRRARPLPDERARRAGVVRLSVPANGVDRPVPGRRELGRRRPAQAHPQGHWAMDGAPRR